MAEHLQTMPPTPSSQEKLRQGHALQMQGKYAEATTLYRQVLSAEPRNAPADHVHNFLTRDGTPPPGSLQQQRSTVTSPPRTPSVRSARHPGHRQPRRVIEARRTLPLMRGIR